MKKFLLSGLLLLLSVVSFSNPRPKDHNYALQVNDSLIHFFRTIDPVILQSGNEKLIIQHLSDKNNDMFKYLADRYPRFGPYDMIETTDETATWVALVYALYEAAGFGTLETGKQSFQGRIPEWVICVLDVIGAVTGITEVITQLSSLSAGSVWSVIKTIVKKHLKGWVSVAFALIRILDDCF